MKALTLRQPWAWMVVYGGKTIENRRWNTRFRGPFLIHAGKGMTREEYEDARYMFEEIVGPHSPLIDALPAHDKIERRGGIVGIAELVDVMGPSIELPDSYLHARERDPWHMREQFGFILSRIAPLPFTPYKGELGFFECASDSAELWAAVDAWKARVLDTCARVCRERGL